MALYLGNSEKLKLISNGAMCYLTIFGVTSTTLSTVDGYILIDSNGEKLCYKDSNTPVVSDGILLSSDGNILLDCNKKILIMKER